MTNEIITTERILTNPSGDRIRLYVNGGILYVQKETGGIWVDVDEYNVPFGINEFRYIVDGGILKLQQLLVGGVWGGAEGVDFTTIAEYNPVFLPTDISGIQLWLSSDFGITQVAGDVSQWNDRSGNSNHATQGTQDNQPDIVLNQVNGYPWIIGDDSNDSMSLTSPIILNDFSLFIVINNIDYSLGSSSSSVNYLDHQAASLACRHSETNTFVFPNNSNSRIEDLHRLAGSNTAFRNGVASVTNPLVGATAWTVNALWRRTTTYSKCRICEIIIYNRALSTGEVTQVRNYLNIKYDIY